MQNSRLFHTSIPLMLLLSILALWKCRSYSKSHSSFFLLSYFYLLFFYSFTMACSGPLPEAKYNFSYIPPIFEVSIFFSSKYFHLKFALEHNLRCSWQQGKGCVTCLSPQGLLKLLWLRFLKEPSSLFRVGKL